jgi:hypothetical protein
MSGRGHLEQRRQAAARVSLLVDVPNHLEATMFRSVTPLLLILAVLGSACNDSRSSTIPITEPSSSAEQSNVSGSPNDHAAIQGIIDTFDQNWGVDAATYAAQYAEADWVGPAGQVLTPQQVLALYTTIFPAFAGTTRQSEIRGLTFLTGTIAVLDLDVRVTGALPPFVTPWQPGIARALEKHVLVKRAGEWRIVQHQQTSKAPGVP